MIRPDDILRASAIRRVTTVQDTGSTSSARVHLNLVIRVKNLDFDPQSSQLHVSGQIINETPHTKIGQFHTLDLELNRNFTLEKEIGAGGEGVGWDSIAIESLKDAVDEGGKRRAEAVAVVMQEGLAHICFIGQFQTILKQKIEMSVPRKRQGGGDHDKVSFYYDVVVSIDTVRNSCGILPGNEQVFQSHTRDPHSTNGVQYQSYFGRQQRGCTARASRLAWVCRFRLPKIHPV